MQDPSDLVPIKAEVHGVQIGRAGCILNAAVCDACEGKWVAQQYLEWREDLMSMRLFSRLGKPKRSQKRAAGGTWFGHRRRGCQGLCRRPLRVRAAPQGEPWPLLRPSCAFYTQRLSTLGLGHEAASRALGARTRHVCFSRLIGAGAG